MNTRDLPPAGLRTVTLPSPTGSCIAIHGSNPLHLRENRGSDVASDLIPQNHPADTIAFIRAAFFIM
jgi:hypothetical protein